MRPKAATVSRWAYCCTRAELLSFAQDDNSIFVRLGQCCAGLSRGARDRREVWKETTAVPKGPLAPFKVARARLQSDSLCLAEGRLPKRSYSARGAYGEVRPSGHQKSWVMQNIAGRKRQRLGYEYALLLSELGSSRLGNVWPF